MALNRSQTTINSLESLSEIFPGSSIGAIECRPALFLNGMAGQADVVYLQNIERRHCLRPWVIRLVDGSELEPMDLEHVDIYLELLRAGWHRTDRSRLVNAFRSLNGYDSMGIFVGVSSILGSLAIALSYESVRAAVLFLLFAATLFSAACNCRWCMECFTVAGLRRLFFVAAPFMILIFFLVPNDTVGIRNLVGRHFVLGYHCWLEDLADEDGTVISHWRDGGGQQPEWLGLTVSAIRLAGLVFPFLTLRLLSSALSQKEMQVKQPY
jgi:hypothetical protein